MKAFLLERYGRDTLRLADVPRPRPGDKDLLVQIHAASINPVDFKIRDGKLRPVLRYRLPIILGNDLAGVVVETGKDVHRFRVGDEVYARADKDRIGSFAEFIAIREESVAKKPRTVGMEAAASLPLVALTALQVFERARLQRGWKVLVHAGSGGVGSIAIQLAKHMGAFVATTTSAANLEWVKALGADLVLDYKTTDFSTVLKDYELVLDTLGGKTGEDSLRVLKPHGRLISIAGPPDPPFARDWQLGWLVTQATRVLSHRIRKQARRLGVHYSFLFMSPSGEQLRHIAALVDGGSLRPIVDRVFPFEETLEALAYVERGHARGKVVVKLL